MRELTEGLIRVITAEISIWRFVLFAEEPTYCRQALPVSRRRVAAGGRSLGRHQPMRLCRKSPN